MALARRPACVRDLLQLLRDPAAAATLPLANWEPLLRIAREARLLGTLAHRVARVPAQIGAMPARVAGHLIAANHFVAHRRQLLRAELRAIARVLPSDLDVVLLKGAAYELEGLEVGDGRLSGDVDLMVAREDLERAEAALAEAGWQSETTDAYDQRYYREWSHEVPPMRAPGHALEVDLHHAITPATSRWQPSPALLREGLRGLAGHRFRVLHPADQVIHACVHLFQDTDLVGRLRDIADVDALLRERCRRDEDWAEFAERTSAHGMAVPVGYALRYAKTWFGTPVPPGFSISDPSGPDATVVDWIVARSTWPTAPGAREGIGHRLARLAGTVRYHWLRMPPSMLVPHLARKSLRRMTRSSG